MHSWSSDNFQRPVDQNAHRAGCQQAGAGLFGISAELMTSQIGASQHADMLNSFLTLVFSGQDEAQARRPVDIRQRRKTPRFGSTRRIQDHSKPPWVPNPGRDPLSMLQNIFDHIS